ncbi:hypothetical protein EYF80_046913 [Liparis tanakae]|uniref:Uncharacterized protein n=1 Tax=Liparis tanakae TaxID=230148 RepID=A0A4Z2FPW0_9TELE|nr:hypothetical protein EYF80_046913 [Liparis tanakae]
MSSGEDATRRVGAPEPAARLAPGQRVRRALLDGLAHGQQAQAPDAEEPRARVPGQDPPLQRGTFVVKRLKLQRLRQQSPVQPVKREKERGMTDEAKDKARPGTERHNGQWRQLWFSRGRVR